MNKKISEKELVEDLIRVKTELNKIPTMEEYSKYGKYSLDPFLNIKRWKQWKKDLFGSEKGTNSLKIPNKKVIEDLKRVYDILGRLPSKNEYKELGKYSSPTVCRIYDLSWSETMKKIFGEYRLAPKAISNEDLIENLKYMKRKLGREPQKTDLNLKSGSKYSNNAYVRAFGNLANALIAADIQPHQVRNLSREEFLDDLKKIYKMLGRTPQLEEYYELSKIAYSFSTIKRRFGSWTRALIAADIPVVNSGKADKELVKEELWKWYKKIIKICLA